MKESMMQRNTNSQKSTAAQDDRAGQKTPAARREKTCKLIIGIASAVVLAVLALRYPALPASVPTKIRLDGTLGNYIPKLFFALAAGGGLAAFNAYLWWFRDSDEPLRVMTVIVFLLVCGGILFSILI